jgi:hypothetical protein
VLLAGGASVDAQRAFDDGGDTPGPTALILAASYGHTECVKLLLEARATVTRTSGKGCDALFSACSSPSPTSSACVKLLLAAHASPTTPNKKGATPLVACCHAGNAASQLLLAAAAALPTGEDWAHAIFVSCFRDHPTCLELLLRPGATLPPANWTYSGKTPLGICCASGFDGCVSLLIAAGADPNQPCSIDRAGWESRPLTACLDALCLLNEPRMATDVMPPDATPPDGERMRKCVHLLLQAGAQFEADDRAALSCAEPPTTQCPSSRAMQCPVPTDGVALFLPRHAVPSAH